MADTTSPRIKEPATDPAAGSILVWNGQQYVPIAPGTSGHLLKATGSGTLPEWVAQSTIAAGGAAGGYLSGTYPNPNVTKVLGSNGTASATAGDVGEYVESVVAAGSAVGAAFGDGEYGNITSISLTAGDWLVAGAIGVLAGTFTEIHGAVSVNSGNTSTDHIVGSNEFRTALTVAQQIVIPQYRLLITGTTTVYLKAKCIGTEASIFYGRISATRIR